MLLAMMEDFKQECCEEAGGECQLMRDAGSECKLLLDPAENATVIDKSSSRSLVVTCEISAFKCVSHGARKGLWLRQKFLAMTD